MSVHAYVCVFCEFALYKCISNDDDDDDDNCNNIKQTTNPLIMTMLQASSSGPNIVT